MKAVIYENYGPPDVLKIKEMEKPTPKKNEVLVKVYATAVTTGDVRLRKAEPFIVRLFSGLLRPKKKILGINFAGKVEQIAEDVREFKIGDEVFGSTAFNFGCYAEYICIKSDEVIAKKPKNISFEEAAVVPFGGLTSLFFLKKANIKKDQEVLIYGASGALGTAGVQIAKYFGANVTGVCSTDNIELVKNIGAKNIIDYKKENYKEVQKIYDVIYDTVGKSPFFTSLSKLKDKGVYLQAVHIPPSSLLKDLWVRISSKKKIIGGISIERKSDLEFLKKIIEEDKFKPVIGKNFTLEKISEAHEYVETGHKVGNVAITIISSTKNLN